MRRHRPRWVSQVSQISHSLIAVLDNIMLLPVCGARLLTRLLLDVVQRHEPEPAVGHDRCQVALGRSTRAWLC